MNNRRVQSAKPNLSSKNSAVIPLTEIQAIQQKLKSNDDESLGKVKQKFELYEKSKQRSKNWPNTLAAIRKKKDQSKLERFIQDELQRRKLEEEEEIYQKNVKKQILTKANQQIFENNDRFRQFQSKMLISDALQEREGQMQIKKMKSEMEKEKDAYLEQIMKEELKKQDDKEAQKLKQLKEKKNEQQKMLRNQHEEMKDQYIKKIQELKIEGELIKNQAQEELEKEREKQMLRKQKQLDNQIEIKKGNEILKAFKEKEKEKEQELDKKIEDHARKKEKILEIRKIRDQIKFKEKQEEKQKLIDIQVQNLQKQKEKQELILNKHIKEAEIKAEQVEEIKREKRKKLQSAIASSRAIKQLLTQEDEEVQKKQDKEFQDYWIQRNKELHKQELEEKMEAKRIHQELNDIYKKQMKQREVLSDKQISELQKEMQEQIEMQNKVEKDDKIFEQWATKVIDQYKKDGKKVDILSKQLKSFKYQ